MNLGLKLRLYKIEIINKISSQLEKEQNKVIRVILVYYLKKVKLKIGLYWDDQLQYNNCGWEYKTSDLIWE